MYSRMRPGQVMVTSPVMTPRRRDPVDDTAWRLKALAFCRWLAKASMNSAACATLWHNGANMPMERQVLSSAYRRHDLSRHTSGSSRVTMEKTLKRFEHAMEHRLQPLKASAVAWLWQRLSGFTTRQLWWLARPLARLVQLFNPRERRVTRQNLRQAFPRQNKADRGQLASESLAHSTATMLELGMVWLGDENSVRDSILEVHGRNLLDEARSEGRGVIVLAPHFGNWEVLNFWLSSHFPFTAMYEPPKFERLDPIIRHGRERMGARLVPTNSRGVAALLKALKRAEAIGILPDQEPGRGSGVFADFYDRPAYTATLLPKLVARTEARVVVGVAQRLEDGFGFAIHFLAADEGVYEEDEVASARGVNASVEAAIALAPAQYQWEYKRWRKSPQEMNQEPGWREHRFYERTYSRFTLKGWRRTLKQRRRKVAGR